MKDMLLMIGLVLLALFGSCLDSTGVVGYIAAAGVLAGLGLIGAGARM